MTSSAPAGADLKILYLVPDFFGPPGGIARYCRLVARVLCESALVGRLDIVALWDRPDAAIDARYLTGDKFTYNAYGGNRRAFALAAVRVMAFRTYDLILCGHVGFAPLRLAVLGRRPQPRHMTFIYGTDAWDRLPWHKRWALRASDLVIAISEYTASRATVANCLDRERLRLLHNCLDPAFESCGDDTVVADIASEQAWSGRGMVTVSRLSRGKGHHVVLRALPSVLKQVPDLHYWVVGDGELRAELEQLAYELGIGERTHFVGVLSDSKIRRLMDRSELYVMPSKGEGFGFVFLEAMARGLPIVAGNRDASPEVLGQEAGLVVDPESQTQVAGALIKLLSDPPLRQRLALSGRQRLDAMFRYPRFREALLSHLCEALHDR